MLSLIPPERLFPARTPWAIRRFWLVYWWWFFVFLPWMLLRQLAITARDLWWAWRTAGRSWTLLDGRLRLGFVGGYELLLTAGMFGERFTWLRWGDVVIDPGPARMRGGVLDGLTAAERAAGPPAAVVCTHFHEEHIGNAALVARSHGVPLLATPATLAALRRPPALPGGRALLMGQAEPADSAPVELRELAAELRTPQAALTVLAAPGHCAGHIALWDAERGVLFAGDAFLHQIFTAPNADTDHAAWIATIADFARLPVRTLVGAHHAVISCDPALPPSPGVVVRADPQALIADKLAFMRWAAAVVAEGERRGLPYSVIEACVFPWQRTWSWRTWFHDEGMRLLTCGEFSRTHFVRSLSATPAAVPVRFPAFLGVATPLARTGPELLRVHVLASRLEPVLVIAGSVLLSAAVLLLVARACGLVVAAPADGGHLPTALASAAPWLIGAGRWDGLAAVLATWVAWWSVVGGAITRRMALALAGEPRESWTASLRWCLRPALLVPSALASLCLLAVAVAVRWPLPLLAMPLVWLVAGFLYAPLCLERKPLRAALAGMVHELAAPGKLARRQAVFLLGFAASTSVVYLLAAAWFLLARLAGGAWDAPLTLLLAAPAAVYALGYTTANLKSLQLWLWLRRADP